MTTARVADDALQDTAFTHRVGAKVDEEFGFELWNIIRRRSTTGRTNRRWGRSCPRRVTVTFMVRFRVFACFVFIGGSFLIHRSRSSLAIFMRMFIHRFINFIYIGAHFLNTDPGMPLGRVGLQFPLVSSSA